MSQRDSLWWIEFGSSRECKHAGSNICCRAMSASLIPKDRIPLRHLLVFGWLPSPLKRLAYRWLLGYRIGKGVRFSFGGIVVGKSVDPGDHVEIGLFAIVQAGTISIGRHSTVGTTTNVSSETL